MYGAYVTGTHYPELRTYTDYSNQIDYMVDALSNQMMEIAHLQ